MTWIAKLAIVLAAVALVAVVGQREFGFGLTPEKTEAHGSEEGHAGDAHSAKHAEGDHGHEKLAKADADDPDRHSDKHGEGEEHGEDGEGAVKLKPAQISAAGIETALVASGTLVKEISVPGRIALNLEKQAKVVPKLSGTVASALKRLGETVEKDDVLATIESREIADAKSEYLEAWRSEELAKGIFEREERLWKQKVTAEQEYLNAKNAYETAKIKLELAHQKLHTFGLSEDVIGKLGKVPDDPSFRLYEIRSPIAGQVTARDLVLGQTVGTEKDIFTIADLSTVWLELAIQPNDLPFAKIGQDVRMSSGAKSSTGKIVILSPVIDPDTRSAKAIAEVDNASRDWKLGDSVAAKLISDRIEVNLVVPQEAIQTIKGQKSVFVEEAGGFKLRAVTTGREDSTNVEVVSGLEFGETIAIKNTFTLKAELGKAEAEHEH